MALLAVLKRAIDEASLDWIDGAVFAMVMRYLMHVPAQYLLGLVTKQFRPRVIDERAPALLVDSINSFSGRLQ